MKRYQHIDDGRLPEEQPGAIFDVSQGFRASASFIEFLEDWDPSETRESKRPLPPSDPEVVQQAAVYGGVALRAAFASADLRPGLNLLGRMQAINDGFSSPKFIEILEKELVKLDASSWQSGE